MSGICSQQNLKSGRALYRVWKNAVREGHHGRSDELS